MIIFNLLGAVFFLILVMASFLIQHFFGKWGPVDPVGDFVLGSLTVLLDGGYRATCFREQGRWRFLSPSTGGHLFFIPVWGFGVVWILVGCYALATDRAQEYARHEAFMSETVRLLEGTVELLEGVKTREEWEAAEERVEQCQRRLRELPRFYRTLSDSDRRRLQQESGERIARVAHDLSLLVARLRLLRE
ncbi:MAG TPA: hypothetical protein VEL76_08930 [Gemmataceae bacterium]|nr:hypothetical protein [Gemmataceae bacterium]